MPVDALEIAFALYAAQDPLKLSTGVEDENFAGVRIGDINVVGGIHGDALRGYHSIG